MRLVFGQGILELKETQGKTTSGKWRLPSLIMSMSSPKEYISLRTKSSILTIITKYSLTGCVQSLNSYSWEDYVFHLGKSRISFFRSFL